MHVMVATDGSLDPTKTAEMVAKLAADGGRVTVLTVVEVPRGMLDEMRAAASTTAEPKITDVSVEYQTTQAGDEPVARWVGDDAIVTSYVKRKVADRTAGLVAALGAIGIEPTVVGEEGESAAAAVIKAARTHGVDILCIGTHGLGRFEGLLGSLSTKVARLAPCSVVLVR